MKTQTTITEITKEDLVDLFSSALYGSSYLSADYDEEDERDDDDCFEETLASILLNGGRVRFTDGYAEDGEVYGNLPCIVEKNEEYDCFATTYFVTLQDVMDGLTRAANGTFNAGENDEYTPDWRDRNIEFARRSFNAFLFDEASWDALTADCLMQIILFDQIVYG